MRIVNSKIRYIIAVIISVMVIILTYETSIANIFMISSDWNYQVFGADYQIIKNGNLSTELKKQNDDLAFKEIIDNSNIHKVFYDNNSKKMFMVVGNYKAGIYDGIIVYDLSTYKMVKFISKKMSFEGDVFLKVDNKANVVYISFLADGQSSSDALTTEAYNNVSYDFIKKYLNTSFEINNHACVFDGKIFDGRIYDLNTGIEIKKTGIPLGVYLYDCQNGYALGILSDDISEPVKLLLTNISADPISKREIQTSESIEAINTANEFYLSKDAKFIIRDEQSNGPTKTGRLLFIEVNTGINKEIKLPTYSNAKGIVGFSTTGEVLLYNVGTKLYLISVSNQNIVKELNLPFEPQAVIWQ